MAEDRTGSNLAPPHRAARIPWWLPIAAFAVLLAGTAVLMVALRFGAESDGDRERWGAITAWFGPAGVALAMPIGRWSALLRMKRDPALAAWTGARRTRARTRAFWCALGGLALVLILVGALLIGSDHQRSGWDMLRLGGGLAVAGALMWPIDRRIHAVAASAFAASMREVREHGAGPSTSGTGRATATTPDESETTA